MVYVDATTGNSIALMPRSFIALVLFGYPYRNVKSASSLFRQSIRPVNSFGLRAPLLWQNSAKTPVVGALKNKCAQRHVQQPGF